jgi:hypothetical protein
VFSASLSTALFVFSIVAIPFSFLASNANYFSPPLSSSFSSCSGLPV